jgi:hypothetical protein
MRRTRKIGQTGTSIKELINASKAINSMEDGEFYCLLRFSIVQKIRRKTMTTRASQSQ